MQEQLDFLSGDDSSSGDDETFSFSYTYEVNMDFYYWNETTGDLEAFYDMSAVQRIDAYRNKEFLELNGTYDVTGPITDRIIFDYDTSTLYESLPDYGYCLSYKWTSSSTFDLETYFDDLIDESQGLVEYIGIVQPKWDDESYYLTAVYPPTNVNNDYSDYFFQYIYSDLDTFYPVVVEIPAVGLFASINQWESKNFTDSDFEIFECSGNYTDITGMLDD